MPAPLTTTTGGLEAVADAAGLVVTISTGGTVTPALGPTLGATEGATLGTTLGCSPSPPPSVGRGTTTVVVLLTVVEVRRVVTGSLVAVSMGQTVVPMGISVVVSRPGHDVTAGAHDVMVYVCVE